MKIAFFTRSLPFHRLGGMEEIIWDLAVELAATGQKITVVTTEIEGHYAPFIEQAIQVVPLQAAGGKYSNAWWHESRQYYLENKSDIDIIFGVSGGADAIARLKDRTSTIRQCHGTSWGEVITKLKVHSLRSLASLVLKSSHGLFREIAIYKHYDATVAVGDMVERFLKSFPTNIGTSTSRIELIPNGVSEKRFAFSQNERDQVRQQYGLGRDAKVMLFLARLHREKGIFEALDSFRQLRKTEPDAKMLIVGDGPDRKAVTQYITHHQLDNEAVITGRIQRDDVAKYLSAADIFIFLTKRNEGLPLNILEALANGLPVICSDHINGVPECVVKVNPKATNTVVDLIKQQVSNRKAESMLPTVNTMKYSLERYISLFNSLIRNRSNKV